MKLYRIIFIVLTVLIMHDGFQGEFSSPTLFDFIKWLAWLLLMAAYIYHRRHNDELTKNTP